MLMKIALCLGHSRRINGKRDGGAVSVGNINEWTYNKDLAEMVADRLDPKYGVVIISDYEGSGYTTAMTWLAKHLKELKVDVAAEFHFNSADTSKAHGQEFLHYHSSTKGKYLAECFEGALKRHVPEFTPRGVKGLSSGDRGNEFVKLTSMVSLICEPFFGSSDTDWKIATEKKNQIADAYAEGLTKYLTTL